MHTTGHAGGAPGATGADAPGSAAVIAFALATTAASRAALSQG